MSDEASDGTPSGAPTRRKSLLHDLRTPLNQIIGYSEMLEEEAQDLGQQSFVETLQKIGKAGRRLSELLGEAFDPNKGTLREAAPTHEAGPVQNAESASVEDTTSKTQGQGRLLVVDDNEMNRDMLSRRLKGRGFDVAVAEGGREALDLLAAESFDLVLLDVMMPEVSGLDVLAEVRKTRSRAALPIIMATAKDQSEDIVTALKLGANDYVTKPLDFPVVLARTETALTLKRAVDEIQRLNQGLERRNRFIRKTFGRYLSDEIVDELLEGTEGLQLGGQKREITILMSDLRGFTAMAERLQPEDVVRMLNVYLGVMVDVIAKYRGTIDEFIGDAILVLFGAPTVRDDDAKRAMACAIEMQLAMESVNTHFRGLGLPEVEMGIALNTGGVVAGNIGSEKRTKYGVVGSHVNLTSRIESYTVGGQVLISDRTRESGGAAVQTGRSIQIEAKGFKDPITVHDLRGIGAPYDVALIEKRVEWHHLEQPLPVRYAIMEGKHVGLAGQPGELTELADGEGIIRTTATLAPFTNLRFNLIDAAGHEVPGDVYAKVSADDSPAGSVRLRFTSVPPGVKEKLEAITGPHQPS
jgi:adenylate cyclase